jgi:hypothetical protein
MGKDEKWKKLMKFYNDMFMVPYQSAVKRELREEEDLFMLLCFSEILGLPNPVSYYTLELYPIVYEKFHEWHTRMGMEKSPLDGIRCC